MNCADLDSLLEAHLERRLGRSEIDALRRHLLTCRRCRHRVHELRRFELDVAARVPQLAAEHWSVLEVEPAALLMRPAGDLPAPGRARVPATAVRSRPSPVPAPNPSAQRRRLRPPRLLTRVVGIALLALAGLGLIDQLDRTPWSNAGRQIAPDAGRGRLDFETPDADRLQAWLAAELGDAPPLPPVPGEWKLLGGRIEGAGTSAEPVVVYESGSNARIAVRILKDHVPGRDGVRDGLEVEHDGFAYVVEGPLAPRERAVLATPAAR